MTSLAGKDDVPKSHWQALFKTKPSQALIVLFPYLIITYVFLAYVTNQHTTKLSPAATDLQLDADVSPATRERILLYERQPNRSGILFNVSHGNALYRITQEPVLRPGDLNITGYVRPDRGFLTIGIPTVYRQNAGTSYVKGAMESIISHTTEEEKSKVVILLFLADFNETLRQDVSIFVKTYYSQYLESGFIQMMEVTRQAYPPLTGLKRNFNDEPMRVSWRSKQVVDFAFMFYYGRNLSNYYIQLEDDVVSSPAFVPAIESFIKQQKKKWVTLQFSELGFIGKLYRSSDLDRFARFLIEFYAERPVDFLLSDFARLLSVSEMPLRKPTLFQHMGTYSSLILSKNQKMNKLKDKYFKNENGQAAMDLPKKHKSGDNPPASFFTTMDVYKKFTPEKVYSAKPNEYFWATNPSENDSFVLVFKEPQYLEEVIVETGRTFQMNDYLRYGVLLSSEELLSLPPSGSKDKIPICSNYTELAQFKDGRVEVEDIDTKRKIRCLKVIVSQKQKEWLIIDQMIIWKAKS